MNHIKYFLNSELKDTNKGLMYYIWAAVLCSLRYRHWLAMTQRFVLRKTYQKKEIIG